jgi:hypothetical protein
MDQWGNPNGEIPIIEDIPDAGGVREGKIVLGLYWAGTARDYCK